MHSTIHNLIPVGFDVTGIDSDTTVTNPEIWAKRVLREHLVKGFWSRFVGPEGSGKPIIQKTELLDKAGDQINITTTTPLTGAGQTGDARVLTGNEEALSVGSMTVIPENYAHAVRWNRRKNKKSILEFREEARMRLREWGAEKMDDTRFSIFAQTADLNGVAYTPNTYAAGGGSSPDVPGDVAAGDHIDVAELQKIKLALVNAKAKPVNSEDGLPFYFLVMHPNCAYNLKQDTRYEQWVREAMRRGERNPLFTGALAVVDGMVLYEHPNVPTAADGAGSIAVARNIAFGAEAFLEGVDENAHWAEEDFDYGREFGIAYEFAFQPRRALALSSLLVYADAVDVV
jgi:N4-gp56 family major capsid protein